MLEKFLAALERIADAIEVIASSPVMGNPGADAPRTPSKTETKKDDKKADAKPADKKADKKAAASDPTDPDPLGGGDPLGGDGDKREYKEKEVRDILSKVIDKEGREAAFKILAEKGKGAKSFTDLKKECFEDVYVACEDALA